MKLEFCSCLGVGCRPGSSSFSKFTGFFVVTCSGCCVEPPTPDDPCSV